MKYRHWLKSLKTIAKRPHVLPDNFVAGAIITKLPHSWRDFATSLKHKRKEFNFDDLMQLLMLKRRREQRTHVEMQ
jgi:hypothetical protein